MRRQSCQQDGAEQQRERAAPPGHVCASAYGGVSGAQSRFACADCPAGQPCRPADRRAPCRADFRVESVHVSPPSLAAVYALRRFFMRAGGLPCGGFAPCIPGAESGRRLQPQQKRYPAGGLALFAACRPCLSGSRRGLGGFGRLPALPLALFLAPIPPPPFPAGRGRDYSFLMQGAAPLASPGLNPGGTYSPNKKGTRRGGLPCLPPADHAFSLFSFPHPPSPRSQSALPLRGRGD